MLGVARAIYTIKLASIANLSLPLQYKSYMPKFVMLKPQLFILVIIYASGMTDVKKRSYLDMFQRFEVLRCHTLLPS